MQCVLQYPHYSWLLIWRYTITKLHLPDVLMHEIDKHNKCFKGSFWTCSNRIVLECAIESDTNLTKLTMTNNCPFNNTNMINYCQSCQTDSDWFWVFQILNHNLFYSKEFVCCVFHVIITVISAGVWLTVTVWEMQEKCCVHTEGLVQCRTGQDQSFSTYKVIHFQIQTLYWFLGALELILLTYRCFCL